MQWSEGPRCAACLGHIDGAALPGQVGVVAATSLTSHCQAHAKQLSVYPPADTSCQSMQTVIASSTQLVTGTCYLARHRTVRAVSATLRPRALRGICCADQVDPGGITKDKPLWRLAATRHRQPEIVSISIFNIMPGTAVERHHKRELLSTLYGTAKLRPHCSTRLQPLYMHAD